MERRAAETIIYAAKKHLPIAARNSGYQRGREEVGDLDQGA